MSDIWRYPFYLKLKELAMGYQQTIKNNFLIEQCEKFGISDKR